MEAAGLSAILKANPVFAQARGAALETLLASSKRVRHQANALILAQSEPSFDAFLVLSGRLLAVLHSKDGREVAFDEIRAGQLVGELAAIDGKPRSVSVYALNRAELLCIPATELTAFLAASPRSAMALMQEMAARIRKLTDLNYQMVAYNVGQRVKAFIVREALESGQLKPGGVLQPFPTHAQIATRIGSNRETVSRTLSQLVKAKVIRSGRCRLEILDVYTLVSGQTDD